MAVGDTWFEQFKNALWEKFSSALSWLKEETISSINKMGWVEAIEAAKQFKSDFVAVKGKFKSWLDTYFSKLSQWIGTEDTAKPKKTSKSTSTIEITKSSTEDVAVVSNEWSKSIDYPELANKKLMEFDAGLSAVQATWFSEFRIKDKLDQSKLSAEQIKNLDAFDKVQASLYIMLRNASKRDLPAGFLMRASVVMTKDLFDHMGDGKSSWWFDLSKTTEWINALSSNKTIWAWVWEFKKSIDSFGQSIRESWITEMLNTVQTGLSMFNDIPEVSKKWNNFFAWIWDGDLSGIDLTKSSIPAIYAVYQWCKSWYPSTEQTQWLNVAWNDADWISKNSGKMLSTDATMLWYLDKNTKKIIDSIINKENQDTLKKIVNQWESIVDTLLSAAGDSEYAINAIESILKRLSGIFGWDAMRTLWSILGVDMSTLLDTLDAKLSPKQEQQLTAFLNHYQKLDGTWPHEWEQYIVDDPESKKQWVIRTINLSGIKAWLATMTPAASLVSSFAGEDAVKRAIYFDKDESWALTVLKDWSSISDIDKWVVGDYYLKNEATIKNLIKDVIWAEWDDMKVVGRVATWYMKWARGDKFYENYMSKHASDKKEKDNNSHETIDDSENNFTLSQKIPLNESWKTNLNTKLYALDNNTKLDFALARIGVGTNSLFTKAATNILKAREVWEDRLANFVLWMWAVAYGESKFNTNLVNNIRPDKHQKSYGIWQRSLDGNPTQAIKDDVIRLSKSSYAQWLSIPTSDIDVNDSQIQALSYLWYLLDKDWIKKDSYNIFERVTNLPTMSTSEVDVAVRDQIQFSAKEAKNGKDVYSFLRNSTIADHLEVPAIASTQQKQEIKSKQKQPA
jgi:hypothetical protein